MSFRKKSIFSTNISTTLGYSQIVVVQAESGAEEGDEEQE